MSKRYPYALVLVPGLVLALAAPGAAERTGTADHGGRPLTATLLGANEVGGGDPNARGTALVTLNPGQEQVCFELRTVGAPDARHAHVHRGPAGVAGPPVVLLAPAPTGGFSTGCVAADRSVILEILRDPSGFYVNVHYPPYHAGALRGQLSGTATGGEAR